MAVIMMMIALQFNQNWLVFGIVALMIISNRTLGTTIVMTVTGVMLFVLQGSLDAYWPFVLFGLIAFAVLIGGQGKGSPEMYPPDPYGGMLGGGMGAGPV